MPPTTSLKRGLRRARRQESPEGWEQPGPCGPGPDPFFRAGQLAGLHSDQICSWRLSPVQKWLESVEPGIWGGWFWNWLQAAPRKPSLGSQEEATLPTTLPRPRGWGGRWAGGAQGQPPGPYLACRGSQHCRCWWSQTPPSLWCPTAPSMQPRGWMSSPLPSGCQVAQEPENKGMRPSQTLCRTPEPPPTPRPSPHATCPLQYHPRNQPQATVAEPSAQPASANSKCLRMGHRNGQSRRKH